ncbi:hypothetical protein Tco_0407082 [Tanacetum coccineum]
MFVSSARFGSLGGYVFVDAVVMVNYHEGRSAGRGSLLLGVQDRGGDGWLLPVSGEGIACEPLTSSVKWWFETQPPAVRAFSEDIALDLPKRSLTAQTDSRPEAKKHHGSEDVRAVPLDGLHFNNKLRFVEESIEITDHEAKWLKRSRIPLVKVRWNLPRELGPVFTWDTRINSDEIPTSFRKDRTVIVPDEERTVDYEVLEKRFPFINWESKFYHFDIHGAGCIYYRIFRSDGSSRWIKSFSEMVTRFDRMDLEELYNLVMQRFETTTPEGVDLVLLEDLRIMFEETADDDIWKNQEK